MSPKRLLGSRLLLIIVLGFSFPLSMRADEVQIKPDHPERYTVVKGDTLWDISSRFLKSPWHWPRIWKINDQIKNPHLIYPGDVIVFRMVNGQPELSVLRNEKLPAPSLPSVTATEAAPAAPAADGRTVKISPQAHSENLEAAIPTIKPNAILPFLSRPLVVESNELDDAGYVTTGLDDRIALGNGSEFYARGLKDEKGEQEYYYIFRPGNPVRHPETGELLGYEAIYLGDAHRMESGDPTKLVVTQVKQEIIPSDRLLAAPAKVSLPYYYPHSPKTKVQGSIVSALNSVEEIGPMAIVGISLGTREGIEEGNVLRVMRHVGDSKDPVTRERYALPDEESGLVLIFRTYEKMSYGLIMTATRPIHMLDNVITP
ncbi:MAG: LysM peptidoglycan-binding domain-containing protein [Gammaproteobacteria bacterium]|nr:LysM peptidoglycan-binding domain-containing protein [Gammaproteobacteria bacterium]